MTKNSKRTDLAMMLSLIVIYIYENSHRLDTSNVATLVNNGVILEMTRYPVYAWWLALAPNSKIRYANLLHNVYKSIVDGGDCNDWLAERVIDRVESYMLESGIYERL